MLLFPLVLSQAPVAEPALLAQQDRLMNYVTLEATLIWDERPSLKQIVSIAEDNNIENRDVAVDCSLRKDGHVANCIVSKVQNPNQNVINAVNELQKIYKLRLPDNRMWAMAKVSFVIPFKSAKNPVPGPL